MSGISGDYALTQSQEMSTMQSKLIWLQEQISSTITSINKYMSNYHKEEL